MSERGEANSNKVCRCEERSDEAISNISKRLLRLRLAMTRQTEGEGDKGGEVKKD